jgi:hypothetical protein
MTKTKLQHLAVEVKGDARMPELARLMHVAQRHGVHTAWTADGHVLLGGPDTPAARAALAALQPYLPLLAMAGLVALAESGIPPMGSVEEARDYVEHALVSDRAGGCACCLEARRIAMAVLEDAGTDRERGQ